MPIFTWTVPNVISETCQITMHFLIVRSIFNFFNYIVSIILLPIWSIFSHVIYSWYITAGMCYVQSKLSSNLRQIFYKLLYGICLLYHASFIIITTGIHCYQSISTCITLNVLMYIMYIVMGSFVGPNWLQYFWLQVYDRLISWLVNSLGGISGVIYVIYVNYVTYVM